MQIEHSEFQDQLVRGLSHRMNNILTLFHGYLGMLLDNKQLDADTLAGLAKVKEGAKAASELMDRTSSLARPPSVVWREVKVADFVRMLKPSFDTLRDEKTSLEIETEDDLPPVWGDASRIKTAIFEIVKNALQATATGGRVCIAVTAAPQPSGGSVRAALQWVSISITDDGPGIPTANVERIYQPFFTTKQKQNAAGLGLTVALGFIQQLGGVLRSESTTGRTTFQILLPARAEAS